MSCNFSYDINSLLLLSIKFSRLVHDGESTATSVIVSMDTVPF